MKRIFSSYSFWIFAVTMVASYFVGTNVKPTVVLEQVVLDVKLEQTDEGEKPYYIYKGKPLFFELTEKSESRFLAKDLNGDDYNSDKSKNVEYIEEPSANGPIYKKLEVKRHFGFWSLLPALVAVILCWLVKDPITALLAGIFSGALVLGQYDLTDEVFIEVFASKNAAGVLLLYLWLLGGLMGMWSKTGAAQAFADYMTKHFVKGPKSAKVITWLLGVIFFQGGTVSTVLVGTTVKPLADKEKISHEELSYIVDSTASPIAIILAFNAWPGYVQAFLFVPGVTWLATESDRLSFFFSSIPLSFYAIFAVLGTFLLSIDKAPFLGKKLKDAIARARETGELDHPESEPLSAKELTQNSIPKYYTPHIADFFVPLFVLIAIAVGTFVFMGSPKVRQAFGIALMVSVGLAMIRGLKLKHVVEGISDGLKGVVVGSAILLLAITIGTLSKEAGGGMYLVELLGSSLPYWSLPVILQILTVLIAFSTGTSWGTFAVAFPLAMPLSWAITQSVGMAHPEFYMMICFAAVMNGSVFGDQCSPISDTTVLSAMCTGCDLMDHVTTQLPPAVAAASLAGVLWTVCTFFAL